MFLKIRKDICSTFKFWGIIMSLIIQRGVFRPRLKDLIQMNTPRVVIQESKKAFRAIFKRNDLEAAMGALSNLKGVGPAMASGRPFQPLSRRGQAQTQWERKTRVLWKPLWSGWNCVWCVVFCTRARASNKLSTSRDFKLCALSSSAASSTRSWPTWSGSTRHARCRRRARRRSGSFPTWTQRSRPCVGSRGSGAHSPQVEDLLPA